MKSPARNIPSLDGLRAISIFLVIISHTSSNFWVIYHDKLGRIASIIQTSLLFGHLGVMIFFVISGFLITTLLLREESINLKKFYFRRTFRIFPPYYVYLFSVFLLNFFGIIQVGTDNFVFALTYTSNYYAGSSWFLAHTWSLSVEEQFYLIFPVFLLLLGKNRILVGLSVVIIMVPLCRFFYFLIDPAISVAPGFFETIADSIAFGCLLSVLRNSLHNRKIYCSLLQSKSTFIVCVLCAFGINWISHFPKYYSKPFYLFVLITIQNLAITYCLDYCVTNHTSRIGCFLNNQYLVFVGTISYSLYLWQEMFLSSELTIPFILKFLLIIVFSLLSYYLLEKPSLRLRNYIEKNCFLKDFVKN